MAEFNGTIGITKEDSISSYKPEKSRPFQVLCKL